MDHAVDQKDVADLVRHIHLADPVALAVYQTLDLAVFQIVVPLV